MKLLEGEAKSSGVELDNTGWMNYENRLGEPVNPDTSTQSGAFIECFERRYQKRVRIGDLELAEGFVFPIVFEEDETPTGILAMFEHGPPLWADFEAPRRSSAGIARDVAS